ncbi:UNVERIFIED_CONTAM: anti-sigma B factor antagonist [Acetivibrio alkalicellulosi]
MSDGLSFTKEKSDEYVKVSLVGEVDIYTSQDFKNMLYEVVDCEKMNLIIDCKQLNYIDSTGLGIFVGALKKVKQYDKKIVLTNLKDNIKKLFVITGLDKVFVIE